MISGHWFEANSSTRRAAQLQVHESHYTLSIDDEIIHHGDIHDIDVSDRIGSMVRRLSWPDGAVFETTDNDSVDTLLRGSDHRGARSLVLHHFERSWRWVAVGVVVAIAVTFASIRWGLPAASENIADALPVSAHETVSIGAMATLDKIMLDPSNLSDTEQAEIRARFDTLAGAVPSNDFTLKLHFREMFGTPNAFALPGGDIVVTDALVDLVEHPDELDSVMLHEIGHVLEHHGMQHAIQASAISLVLGLALGDLSGIGEVAVGVPIFLLQSSYSRKSETEADEFAFSEMAELGKDPKHFANIIIRLSEFGDRARIMEEIDREASDSDDEKAPSDYFSSHPDSRKRAQRAIEVSRELGF